MANSFRTGSNSGGYTLQSVTVDFKAKVGNPGALTVRIDRTVNSKPAANYVSTLSGDDPTTAGQYIFTCSDSCSLAANRTYWVVLYSASGNYSNDLYDVVWTASNSETNAPSSGTWEIGDVAYFATGNSNLGYNEVAPAVSFKFKVTAVPK